MDVNQDISFAWKPEIRLGLQLSMPLWETIRCLHVCDPALIAEETYRSLGVLVTIFRYLCQDGSMQLCCVDSRVHNSAIVRQTKYVPACKIR